MSNINADGLARVSPGPWLSPHCMSNLHLVPQGRIRPVSIKQTV